MNILKFFRRKERKLADDMISVPSRQGYVSADGSPTMVRVAILSGTKVCWSCGDPFRDDNYGEFALNDAGAIVAMHGKCGTKHLVKNGIRHVPYPQKEDSGTDPTVKVETER